MKKVISIIITALTIMSVFAIAVNADTKDVRTYHIPVFAITYTDREVEDSRDYNEMMSEVEIWWEESSEGQIDLIFDEVIEIACEENETFNEADIIATNTDAEIYSYGDYDYDENGECDIVIVFYRNSIVTYNKYLPESDTFRKIAVNGLTEYQQYSYNERTEYGYDACLSLSSNVVIRTVLHEICHAFGFAHELYSISDIEAKTIMDYGMNDVPNWMKSVCFGWNVSLIERESEDENVRIFVEETGIYTVTLDGTSFDGIKSIEWSELTMMDSMTLELHNLMHNIMVIKVIMSTITNMLNNIKGGC